MSCDIMVHISSSLIRGEGAHSHHAHIEQSLMIVDHGTVRVDEMCDTKTLVGVGGNSQLGCVRQIIVSLWVFISMPIWLLVVVVVVLMLRL